MRLNHTTTVVNRKEPIIIALGDIILFVFSLWATLVIRYGALPSFELFEAHRLPFLIVFAFSLVVFYIAGLYGRSIHISRVYLPGMILRAQLINGLMAVIIFYFVPSFSVTPKINLFVYILLSSVFIILWRLNTYPLMSLRKKYPALVIGSSPETDELISEMTKSPRIGLYCREKIKPEELSEKLIQTMEGNENDFQYVVADLEDKRVESVLSEIYKKFFGKATIIDLDQLYEEVFQMIPLSRMNYAWIMSQISLSSSKLYDLTKRGVDIILSVIVGLIACILYPFVALAIKLEDRGPVFISQERIGKNGKVIKIYKFRSMQKNDLAKWVSESANNDNKVTKVGKILRKTRIDELPQALAIFKGDMSIIGPRADVIGLAHRLENEIPYYAVRTVITPGLTGWAQINQEKPPQSVEETRLRLSYDLYYISHRSLSFDFQIILRTIKTLLQRAGM